MKKGQQYTSRGLMLAALHYGATSNLAHACATCMGTPGTTQSESVNAALLTMLGVLSLVLGCGAFFVVRMVLLARVTAQHAAVSSSTGLAAQEELES